MPSKLEFEPCNEAQDEYITDDDSFYLGYIGGFGAGKSHVGATRILLDFIQFNNDDFLICAPTYDQLDSSTLVTFRALIEEWDLPIVENQGKKTFSWATRSDTEYKGKIYYRSLQKESLKGIMGMNLFRAWMDEAALVSSEAFKKVLSRLRKSVTKCAKTRMYITTTPNMATKWLYDLFEDEKTLQANEISGLITRQLKARSYDNPHLPPEYIPSLKNSLTEEQYRAEVEGEWTPFGYGLTVFKGAYVRSKHRVPLEYEPELPLYLTIDPGFRKSGWAICQLNNKKLHVLESGMPTDTTTDELADYLLEKLKTNYGDRKPILVCDVAGNQQNDKSPYTSVQILNNRFRTMPVTNAQKIQYGLDMMRWLFRNDRLLINSNTGSLETDPFLTDLDKVLSNTYKYPEKNSGKEEPNHEDSHVVDAIRYLIYEIFKHEYRNLNYVKPVLATRTRRGY